MNHICGGKCGVLSLASRFSVGLLPDLEFRDESRLFLFDSVRLSDSVCCVRVLHARI